MNSKFQRLQEKLLLLKTGIIQDEKRTLETKTIDEEETEEKQLELFPPNLPKTSYLNAKIQQLKFYYEDSLTTFQSKLDKLLSQLTTIKTALNYTKTENDTYTQQTIDTIHTLHNTLLTEHNALSLQINEDIAQSISNVNNTLLQFQTKEEAIHDEACAQLKQLQSMLNETSETLCEKLIQFKEDETFMQTQQDICNKYKEFENALNTYEQHSIVFNNDYYQKVINVNALVDKLRNDEQIKLQEFKVALFAILEETTSNLGNYVVQVQQSECSSQEEQYEVKN